MYTLDDFGCVGFRWFLRGLTVLSAILRFEFIAVCNRVSINYVRVIPAILVIPARGTMGKTGVKTGVLKPFLIKDFY